MTYLMRKQGEKDFNKCKEEDIFKNVIERFEKPKQVSPSNEALIRRNEQECIRISEEIDKRIISEGGYKNS